MEACNNLVMRPQGPQSWSSAGGVWIHGHVCGNNDGTTGHVAWACGSGERMPYDAIVSRGIPGLWLQVVSAACHMQLDLVQRFKRLAKIATVKPYKTISCNQYNAPVRRSLVTQIFPWKWPWVAMGGQGDWILEKPHRALR